MDGSALSSRFGRALILLVIPVFIAAGLVLAGAGQPPQANAAVSPGTTQLVSVNEQPVDQQPFTEGSGQASVSADGRYVAFATFASFDPRDIEGDGGSNLDVYVRDLREQRTVLLSHGVQVPFEGSLRSEEEPDVQAVPANGSSGNPSISADGRYVAFQTTADNLGAQDYDGKTDVVVVDRDPDGNGILDEQQCGLQRLYCHEFTRVSPDRFDEQGRRIGAAGTPSISATGDVVAWVGVVLPGETSFNSNPELSEGTPVVYRSSLDKGPTGAITAVRSHQVNAKTDGILVRSETAPALSADGTRIALVAQGELQGEPEPRTGEGPPVRSAVLGVDLTFPALPDSGGEDFASTRLDVDQAGAPLTFPRGYKSAPTLSGNGRLAAFTSPGAGTQVVRTVTWEPDQVPRSEVVSIDTSGNQVFGADPALSANGRYLAFTTSARSTHNGVDGPQTECNPESETRGPLRGIDPTIDAEIDPDNPEDADLDVETGPDPNEPGLGEPPQLLPTDPAAISHCDIVVRDLVLDAAQAVASLPRLPAELASPSLSRDCVLELAGTDTCEGDDASGFPALSADGGVVAYESEAISLVPDDANGHVQDVFARTFLPSLISDPLNFFTIEPGSSTLGSANLRHVGFGPLVVESLAISGVNAVDFTVTAEMCIGRTLQAGDSCLVSVRFSPSDVGSRQGTLDVRHSGTGSPLPVPLLGIGDLQPPRAFTSIPEPLSFGANLPLSVSQPGTVTVRNTGAARLTISAVGIPTDAGPVQFPLDYAIISDDCTGRTLEPDGTCVVTLQYSPQGVGERPAVLRFDDNAPNAPHLVALQGSGITPLLQFNPAVVQEGKVTTLFGSGFASLRSVIVRLPEIPGPIIITADATGNFSTPVVIFPNSTPGTRIAEATIDGSQPPITATATLLVVPGTVSPPEFDNRR
ncbi:MAG: choice-of-anchor D domain-containing protein [Pseudonocardiaceae bacterium]